MQLNEHPTVKRYREKASAHSPTLNQEKIDADWLKTLALEAGADDAAVVELNRPQINDQRADILEIFPRTKSLVRLIGNGLRAGSAKSFLESLPLIFQRGQSEGLNATYHFTFTGAEELSGTAVIKDQQISVLPGHEGESGPAAHGGQPDLGGFSGQRKRPPPGLDPAEDPH